jgi:2-(1,2-epoxy-1,2-dihydrophenyl)acetyl-CoA isomerase
LIVASDQNAALLSELREGVQTLTLNQPSRMNALSQPMIQALTEALRVAERDDAVRVLVLTGAGKAFSSGADITEFDMSNGSPLIARLHGLEKPVLAAINGVAAGAGLSLALACDLRYAAESAHLTAAFVKIGLVPDAGMLYFLPRLVGPGKTLELSWTGESITAEEAYELGMLNKVVADERLLGHTQEVAARLAHGPARTIALIKRAVNQAHELPLERVLELEASYQTIASRDANFAEGVAAFREKRAPKFSR